MPKFYTIHLNIMNFFKKKFDSKLIKINAKKRKNIFTKEMKIYLEFRMKTVIQTYIKSTNHFQSFSEIYLSKIRLLQD